MTVLITLSGVGSSAGPTFNLYASPDGITFTTIVLGINKTALEAGYTATVPNGTTNIKVTSVGACTNSYVATIGVIPTTTTTSTTAAPPVNSVEWFGDEYYGYGGDPSGGFYQLNGTVEIIGDPVTFRAFAAIPDNAGPGSFDTSIYIGDTDYRYVEVVRPRDVYNERYSTSFTLPAGTYVWQVNLAWFGTGSGGEGGIVWTQA